jgi:hypothetical protein
METPVEEKEKTKRAAGVSCEPVMYDADVCFGELLGAELFLETIMEWL